MASSSKVESLVEGLVDTLLGTRALTELRALYGSIQSTGLEESALVYMGAKLLDHLRKVSGLTGRELMLAQAYLVEVTLEHWLSPKWTETIRIWRETIEDETQLRRARDEQENTQTNRPDLN